MQKVVEPRHSEHVALHFTQNSLRTISLTFVQVVEQVKSVLRTNPLLQDVQVVVVPAQVSQFESQGRQVALFSMV